LQSPTRQIPKYEKKLFPEILALAKSEKALELANQAMEKYKLEYVFRTKLNIYLVV